MIEQVVILGYCTNAKVMALRCTWIALLLTISRAEGRSYGVGEVPLCEAPAITQS